MINGMFFIVLENELEKSEEPWMFHPSNVFKIDWNPRSTFWKSSFKTKLSVSTVPTVPKAIATNRIIILSLFLPPNSQSIFSHFHCSQTPQFSSWNMAKYCFGNFLTLFSHSFPATLSEPDCFFHRSVLPSLPFIIVLFCVWGFSAVAVGFLPY